MILGLTRCGPRRSGPCRGRRPDRKSRSPPSQSVTAAAAAAAAAPGNMEVLRVTSPAAAGGRGWGTQFQVKLTQHRTRARHSVVTVTPDSQTCNMAFYAAYET